MSTRYTKALRATTRGYNLSATLITLLEMAMVWPSKSRVALVALSSVLGMGNIYFNKHVIPRLGETRGEALRALFNLAYAIPVAHFTGWPLARFLWIPFTAIFTNNLDKRVARVTVAVFGAVTAIAALIDGVPPLLPIAFLVFALVCRLAAETTVESLATLIDEAEAANVHLRAETAAREAAQLDLRNAHKMEALGRLAAGVAHEINTPVQYVSDSIEFSLGAAAALVRALEVERAIIFARPSTADKGSVLALEEELDLAYSIENLPLAMERAREGLQRIGGIIRSMRTFAHPGTRERTACDLNRAAQGALDVARNEYRYVARIETDFADLPLVRCRIDEINQVLLNLIVNAAHAVADKPREEGALGLIAIRTRRSGANVVVEVADTGNGIPESIREKVMDPFFTTKSVGRGTGQGLAIARTVVESHGGSLAFESAVGLGTTFRVTLPIAA